MNHKKLKNFLAGIVILVSSAAILTALLGLFLAFGCKTVPALTREAPIKEQQQ